MGNTNARRSNVADTDCASGTYKALRPQSLHVTFNNQISAAEACTPVFLVRSSITSLLKHGSKRSSRNNTYSGEYKQESWPKTQLESLFLPLFPLQTNRKTREFSHVSELADGAFGKVCKVFLEKDRNDYAIKIISKSKVIKENLVNCIRQESEILRAVGHHPFIVNYVDNWQSKRKLYILTEFVPHGELYYLLQKYAIFPWAVVQLYVAQLALVLDFLHNAGVIYRDLKPENLLLDEQFNVKVIDFGFAKWLTYGARTETVCGTPKYMAPEIWGGEPYGHSVDWWSLGVIACRMITGQYVRMHPDPSPLSRPRLMRLPDSVKLDVPSEDLLRRLLELDATKRLKSLRALQRIRFFYKFSFEDVRCKHISGLELWKRHYPEFAP